MKIKSVHRVAAAGLILLTACILFSCGSSREGDRADSDDLLSGTWAGALRYPGLKVRVAFVVSPGTDREMTVSVMMPDNSDDLYETKDLRQQGTTVSFDVPDLRATFTGTLITGEDVLRGRWDQGMRAMDLELVRVEKIEQPNRPQTPKPPFPYTETEIVFPGGEEGVRLSGTLAVPSGKGPFPALILISGGGAQNRDCTIFRHHPFLVISDYLARRGVAVLRFDDRGVGGSTGDRSMATSVDYAHDVLGGVDALAGRGDIDYKKIGLLGHSEGGTIAAISARESPDISFIILIASPGLSGREYNIQYEESVGRSMGLDEEEIARKKAFQEKVLDIVLEESVKQNGPDRAEARLRLLYGEADPPVPPGSVEMAIKRVLSPWFRFSIAYDPAQTLSKLEIPVLALFGGKDVQVPPAGNYEAVKAALEGVDGRLPANRVVEILPGLNHFFQTAPTGNPKEYGEIEETFSPEALEIISDWIARQFQ